MYNFYVHNYSGSPNINVSKATIKIYKENKNKPSYVVNIPTMSTDKRCWKVFSYNSKTRKVSIVNELIDRFW